MSFTGYGAVFGNVDSYGDVIEAEGNSIPINQGKGWRYLDLARIDVTAEGGQAAVSIVTAAPEPTPIVLRLMERHPLLVWKGLSFVLACTVLALLAIAIR